MLIMGHRGAKSERPENTLAGIEFALKQGVDAVEIDVHASSDGTIVVIHDDTLERTTNGRGFVHKHTLRDLKKLDAGEGERVPTLSEVLSLMSASQAKLIIEIKASGIEQSVVDLMRDHHALTSAHVISFNHRIVKRVKQLEPKITTACLLYGLPIDPVAIAKAANADGLSIALATVDRQLVHDCHNHGLTVAAWNANDEEGLIKAKLLGIDCIGTDLPSFAVPWAKLERKNA
jgi:glycerophosphoryl diester phosphodiesterase